VLEPQIVRIYLLGDPGWAAGPGERQPLERKLAALFAYLAIEGAVSRERICALLWPGSDPERGRGNLRQALLRLRRRLGPAFDAVVEESGGDLRIAAKVVTDILEDDGAAAVGAPRALDTSQTPAVLLGDAHFPDCLRFDAWLDRQRAARGARLRTRLLELAKEQFEVGRFDAAVAAAERAIAADPIGEEPYRCLMQWYYLRGDRAAALVTWDRCLASLRRGYGLKPSAGTAQLARSIEASQADSTPPHRAQPISLRLLRPPRLVGRDAAMLDMQTAWHLRHVILVEGEAGLGKTRVLDDFAQADGSVCRSGARPGDGAAPYSAAARLFSALYERYRPCLDEAIARDCARVVSALAGHGAVPPLLTDADRLRFHASIRALVASCLDSGADGLVFDDLQFADAASIELLAMLLDDPVCCSGLRFALAVRRGESTAEVDAVIDRLAGAGRLARVTLEPLDARQIEDLVEGLVIDGLDPAAWSARLTRHVGGNPAFLLELLKTLLAEGHRDSLPAELPIPPTVRSAIERRLHYLSPEAISLAQLAAVAGTDFNVPVAARILGHTPLALSPALAELERAQIMRGTSFAHDIVLDSVDRSVPDAIREYLHRTLAEAMQVDQVPPGRIAVHWVGAKCWDRAGTCWQAAADAAAQTSQVGEQVRFLAQAADCFERAGRRSELFNAMLAIARIEIQPDYGNRLPAYIERLRALQADERERMQVDVVAADLAINRGRYDECVRQARAAAASARRLDLPAYEVAAGGRLAHGLVYLGRPQEALAELDALQASAAALTDYGQRAAHHEKRALAFSACGRLRLAIEAAGQIVQIGRESRNLSLAFEGMYNLGVMHAWHGNAARAAQSFEEAIALRDQLGNCGGIAAAADSQLGATLRDLGHYDAALVRLKQACLELDTDALPGWSIKARAELAEAYLVLGQPKRALEVFGQIPDGLAPPETAARLVVRSRIEREAMHDDNASARETLRAATVLLPASAAARSSLPIAIEQARDLDPSLRGPHLHRLLDEALRAELIGLALYAAALAVAAKLSAGCTAAAAEIARRAASWRDDYEPIVVPRSWMLSTFATALQPSEPQLSATLQAEAADWERRVCEMHLPEEYRASFLQRLHRPRPLLGASASLRQQPQVVGLSNSQMN
jgi:DNA-binding SARP family transcriptional activator